MNLPPLTRDRMAGRYFGQCPSCRTGRLLGPCCGGGGPESTRRRRKAEKAALRRYMATAAAEEAYAEDADSTSCRHGCNGLCELHGGARCDFTCHPPFEEMFGDRYMTDTETRLLADDAIAASYLVGETPEGFYRRLPGACSWVEHLPESDHVDMARECAQAKEVSDLAQVLTEWRHTAEVWADPDLFKRVIRSHNGVAEMDYSIDLEADAAYIRLRPEPVSDTRFVAPWLHVDVDAEGEPVGVLLQTLDLRAVADE